MKVVRFGVSLEKNMLETLDSFMKNGKFKNRSQAIRHLISNIELDNKWNSDQIVGGSIMLSYDHHKRDLLENITKVQHDYHHLILCSQHIHLNHTHCMEIIALKGKASELKELANELMAVKGLIHGELSVTMV